MAGLSEAGRSAPTGWAQTPGGIGGLASLYGTHNSAGARREEREAAMLEDEEFILPRDHQPTDLELPPGERAGIDVPLDANCRGYVLLQRIGWVAGRGLGKTAQGRVDPVPFASNDYCLGLGKATEYDERADEATETRKALTAEVLVREEGDEHAREVRQVRNANNERIQAALKVAVSEFYCDICRKQYHISTEFENHLSSYDHHHTKRLKEAREVEAMRKRQEREAKEARRALKAQRGLDELSAATGAQPPHEAGAEDGGPSACHDAALPAPGAAEPSALDAAEPAPQPVALMSREAGAPKITMSMGAKKGVKRPAAQAGGFGVPP
mmetsp:Transcript_51539/g.121022  ORF Transcript_51539/g.121022 Transcript_51539/m.121022 type:complete len:327 (+) Transcript_51539:22-1002(+)